jgi:hypothetical protein
LAEGGRAAIVASAGFLWLLALLFCVDVAFVVVHVAKPYFDALRPHYFSLEADRGLAEIYQYGKQAFIVGAMMVCWSRTRSVSFGVWAALFAFLLWDDSHAVHEQIGEALGAAWALPAVIGLRPRDFGEILFALAVGTVTLAALLLVHLRERGVAIVPTVNLILLLVALAVCGVVVDAIHVVAYFGGSRFAWLLTVIEDGGELAVMSVIVVYAWQLAAHGLHARWHLPRSANLARMLGGRTAYEPV